MPLNYVPYHPGTIDVVEGSTSFVGHDTNFTVYAERDKIWVAGFPVIIESIIDDEAFVGLFAYTGPDAVGEAYEWEPTPDQTRALTLSTTLQSYFTSGNLSAFAALELAADKGLMATGPGAVAMFDLPSSARDVLATGFSADVTDLLAADDKDAVLDALGIAQVGIRLDWDGSATADADPGDGKVRGNHATNPTVLFISKTSAAGVNISGRLATLDDAVNTHGRAVLDFSSRFGGNEFSTFDVSGAIVDGGTYVKVPVALRAGTIADDADQLVLSTTLSGADGLPGTNGTNGTNGIFAAIASQAEAVAGVENTKGMTALRTREAISALGTLQIARNGSLAIAQRAMPTTDNQYCLDGWRLLMENANGFTVAQDTADVPVGAGYAMVLTVGAGNNGKGGVWSPIENKDMLKLRGDVCSLLVPLKCTAGMVNGTGQIRMAVCYFIGTADSVAGDPVSSWGAEGTNPTLATNWSYASAPTAIPVTTAWVDYKLENQSIPSNATNVAIFIWSDDRATTTTTDKLRIGGKVTLTQGSGANSAIVLPVAAERQKAHGLCELVVLTAASYGAAGANLLVSASMTTKRAAPTVTRIVNDFQYSALGTTGATTYTADTRSVAAYRATTGAAGQQQFSELVLVEADL